MVGPPQDTHSPLRPTRWASGVRLASGAVVLVALLASQVVAAADQASPGAGLPASPGAGPAPSAATSTPPVDDASLLGFFWRGIRRGADFFFRRPEGATQHTRTWGVVPLVIADSNRGFGGGVAFVDRDLLGLGVRGEVNATASSEGFFEPALLLEGPPIAFDIDWSFLAEYRSRPRLLYYGVGNRSRKRDEASLWLEETRVQLRLGYAFTEDVALLGLLRFENVNARNGEHKSEIGVREAFRPSDRVGFGSRGLTNAIGVSLVADHRDNTFDPTFGFRLELQALYHGPEIGDAPFRFGRYAADLAVYLPVVKPGLVLALHGRIELVDANRNRVPFYTLPSLGGRSALRGYLEGRVRDRATLLGQAELRFPIWKSLQGAAFIGAGRVYKDILDPLDPPFFFHFYTSAGCGLRFVLHPDILVRLDLGISPEQTLFWLAFNHAF